jgi:hypothetical protein
MWNDAIKSKIFTTIKVKCKTKFSLTDSNFGTNLISKTTPKFPYICIHRLPGSEVGHTLDKTGVNGILTTYQVDVYSNDKESTCDEISGYIADIMVGDFMFKMTMEPYPDYSSTDEYRYVSRYQRVIGASDTL